MFENAQPSTRLRARAGAASAAALGSTGDQSPSHFKTAIFMALMSFAALAISFFALPDRGKTPPSSAELASLLIKSDIRVSLGASVADLHKAYPETSDLKHMQQNEERVYSESGPDALSFFFDKPDLRLGSIRADPPFAGQILGVRIGDSRSHLISALGNPSKAPFKAFIWDDAYLYHITESSAVRFDVTTKDDSRRGGLKEGVVARIFVKFSKAAPD